MIIDLEKVRLERDHMTHQIVSGLLVRIRFPLNTGVFTEEFCQGKTWFEYRLKKDQDTDSEFGQFSFEDQKPALFEKGELSPSKIKRNPPVLGLVQSGRDYYPEILKLYRTLLPQICRQGEDENSYGQTVKRDVANVLDLRDRTESIGLRVAAAKIEKTPGIINYVDKEDIRYALRDGSVEQRVIDDFLKYAEKLELPNSQAILDFAKGIIGLTVDVEVEYVSAVRKIEDARPKAPVGFGQVEPRPSTGTRGWGSG